MKLRAVGSSKAGLASIRGLDIVVTLPVGPGSSTREPYAVIWHRITLGFTALRSV
ncbi:hypothetical protein ACVIM8_001739 [Bradyrhizobium sp. USDA 4529]